MDSDIGLRSPAEGIVAKRREKFRRKQQSSLSDSNSCDTPTSENSPRDLSMAKGSIDSCKDISSTPNTPTLVKRSPTPPTSASSTPGSSVAPLSFKQPHKPQALHLKGLGSEIPAHCTPSPLTVPSPNWMAVDNYLVGGFKTPKQLDSSVFDFLTPATPRSAKLFRDSNPVLDSERYSKLSPRHSPRLTIPETPTDLSNGGNRMPTDLSKHQLLTKMEDDTEAAQDLSITRGGGPGGHSGPTNASIVHHRLSRETPPLQQTAELTNHLQPQIKQEVAPR